MDFLHSLGKYVLFLSTLFSRPEKTTMYWKETFRQMNIIGIESIPIVAVVSLFVGAVTTLQFAYQIQDFMVPLYYIGYVVRDTMIIEMAPTMCCVMLAGKVGSNIASELGNMRITEQIDALEIMGVNTPAYLVGTKILAAVVTIPLLIILAAFLGIIGGFFATTSSGLASAMDFEKGLWMYFNPFNAQLMLLKAFVFAFLLSSIACYRGFFVKGGAVQIGEASTRAVVHADITILISDFFIVQALLT